MIVSPVLAGLAVSIGVPILLCYVYGVVPIALCRSEGCGVTTSSSGVKIDIDEEQDPPYRPPIVANPSIGNYLYFLNFDFDIGYAINFDLF